MSRTLAGCNNGYCCALKGTYVNDGDPTTRWGGGSTDCWIAINLEASIDLDYAVIVFETAYAKQFKMYGSMDNLNWKQIISVTDGKVGSNNVQLHGVYRYVKIINVQSGYCSGCGMSIWSFEVWGLAKGDNLCFGLLHKQ